MRSRATRAPQPHMCSGVSVHFQNHRADPYQRRDGRSCLSESSSSSSTTTTTLRDLSTLQQCPVSRANHAICQLCLISERHTRSQHYASITPLQITANMTTTTTVRLTPSCETNTRLLCVTTFVYATPRLHQSTRRYFTRWSCCCRKFLLKAFTANAAGAHSAPSGISVRTAPKPAQDRRRHVNCSGSARIVCKAY